MIKRIRYFFGFMDAQEKWLNDMSAKGYRLIRTGKLIYEFEKCDENQYLYCVDFVAHKSNENLKSYKQFLEDFGYQVIHKSLNINWSLGKARLRPYGKKLGKIATSPGNYNKELFIVEKVNDHKPFELHSILEDKIIYYKLQRNVYISMFVLTLFLFIWNYYIKTALMTDFLILIPSILCSFPIVFLQKKLRSFEKQARLNE